jgi:hypothetical protein
MAILQGFLLKNDKNLQSNVREPSGTGKVEELELKLKLLLS